MDWIGRLTYLINGNGKFLLCFWEEREDEQQVEKRVWYVVMIFFIRFFERVLGKLLRLHDSVKEKKMLILIGSNSWKQYSRSERTYRPCLRDSYRCFATLSRFVLVEVLNLPSIGETTIEMGTRRRGGDTGRCGTYRRFAEELWGAFQWVWAGI